MMTIRNYLFITLLLLITGRVQAQNEVVAPALNRFLQTEFMQKMQDLQIDIESKVAQIKEEEQVYTASQIRRVRVAYEQNRRDYNMLLLQVRDELLDPKRMRMVAEQPKYFAKGMELDLINLRKQINQNFVQEYTDVTQEDGSLILFLLGELLPEVFKAVRQMTTLRKEARRYNEGYLNKHLVRPYSLKPWDQVSNSPYNDYDDYDDDAYYDQEDGRSKAARKKGRRRKH